MVGAIFPSPTGGYTHIGDAIIFLAALLFGWKVGALTGIIGSVTADFFLGYPRWYVSIIAHGVEGLIAGLGRGKRIVIQVITCAIGGFIMATTYFYVNIFIKGYAPAIISFIRDLFGQAGLSLIIAIVLVKIIEKSLPQSIKNKLIKK